MLTGALKHFPSIAWLTLSLHPFTLQFLILFHPCNIEMVSWLSAYYWFLLYNQEIPVRICFVL